MIEATGTPSVFLVIPLLKHGDAERQARSRPIPAHVKNALKTLELTEDATFEAIRDSYRRMVKLYHPDKVAHLGPDLKKVAEQKTKELNTAFKVLETFYAS